jgi:hypothetical protein
MPKSIIILFSFWFISCYTRKEACLDTLASNYDVTADDACLNCCTYPKLILNVDGFRKIEQINDVVTNTKGQKYNIQDIRFYVSEFSLFQRNEQIKINEVIGTANNAYVNRNDMKILRSVDASLDMGTVKAFGKFDSLVFYMGLTKSVLENTFVNLPTSHVLSTASKLSDAQGETAIMTMRYKYKSPTQKDSIHNIIILHKDVDNSKWKYVVKDSINLKFKDKISSKGENIEAKINADYTKILQNVDLESPKDTILKKVALNIRSVFDVK